MAAWGVEKVWKSGVDFGRRPPFFGLQHASHANLEDRLALGYQHVAQRLRGISARKCDNAGISSLIYVALNRRGAQSFIRKAQNLCRQAIVPLHRMCPFQEFLTHPESTWRF